jgi:putative heme-binding domain-containing protein
MQSRVRSLAALFALGAVAAAAQTPLKNTVESDPDAARRGSLLFRARCSGCHGLDARGVSGPDLTAVLAGGMSDERFFRIVRSGQGTDMPRFGSEQTTNTQVWEMLTHLRAVTKGAPSERVAGDAAAGDGLFQARCMSCHQVNGRGGRLGPNLSRIGAVRSPGALAAKVRDPNREFVPGYRPVTVVLADGGRVRGVVKNEDAFSIQIMDTAERLRGYRRSDIREVVREPRSLMPSFAPGALPDGELTDLVSYLSTLRGAAAAAN